MIKYDDIGRFLSRVNRFIVELEVGGKMVQCHLHDTGRIDHLVHSGSGEVYVRRVSRLGRRTSCDVVAVRNPIEGRIVVVDSRIPNRIFAEGYRYVLGEESYIEAEKDILGSRLDFLASNPKGLWAVEVKGVNLARGGIGLFPNAPSARAVKHVEVLERLSREGVRGLMVFAALRSDVEVFSPNRMVDPRFSRLACSLRGIVEFAGIRVKVEDDGYSIRIEPVGVGEFRC
ncbi:MAG: DNA/RNA nuclease SfsA [Aeropyrum sp.]|nr:DNA/RNA nuclease SfsA [Aeropyrum sp.]MCE4616156.1 DNA/RNA nuclease SfsA [Aeropyrum sp.]